jgi:curved DNA-binding protein CbpA
VKWNDLKRGYADRISALSRLSPYELLGVQPGSSRNEIKSAYLRLVKVYHPDHADPFMARHNQEMTKLLNIAYDKLRGAT